jgi:hypothetical protein
VRVGPVSRCTCIDDCDSPLKLCYHGIGGGLQNCIINVTSKGTSRWAKDRLERSGISGCTYPPLGDCVFDIFRDTRRRFALQARRAENVRYSERIADCALELRSECSGLGVLSFEDKTMFRVFHDVWRFRSIVAALDPLHEPK